MAKVQSGFLRRELWSPPRLQRPIIRDRRLLPPYRPSLMPAVGALHHPNRRALLHGPLPLSQQPWQNTYLIGATLPNMFADVTTEGTSNHYLYNGSLYASFAAWLTAVSGTFSRSSAKYVVNSSGNLVQLSSGVVPLDYSPTSIGSIVGLLLEGASTNVFTYSNALTTSPWNYISEGTWVQNATGPDGVGSSAWTATAGSTFSRNYRPTDAYTSSGEISFYAQAGTMSYAYIWCVESGGGQLGTWFNISTGAVGTLNHAISGSPVGSFTNAVITPLANGWYRVSAYYNFVSGNYAAGIGFSDSDASISATNGHTAAAFGAQFEALTFASSYIPTTSSSATRAADALEIPWTSATATFRIKSINQTYASGASADLLAANTNSNGDILLGMGSATSLAAIDSAATLTLSAAVSSWRSSNVAGVAGNASGRVLGANNVTPASDAHPLFTATPADIWIGGENAAAPSYGDVSQFGAWTIAATAAQLQAMTNTA